MNSINFELLRPRWPELAELGGFAESYVYNDPASALLKLRTFAENLTKDIYLRSFGSNTPPLEARVKFGFAKLFSKAS